MTAVTRLVADVGGTNTRVALFDEASGQYRAISSYNNREFQGLEQVFEQWLAQLSEPRPSAACIAIAAALAGDQVAMVNIGWSFSRSGLARNLGLDQCRFINDFEANAYALPHLRDEHLASLHPGKPSEHQTLAVVGPGTGLGGATLRKLDGQPFAVSAEPGHAGLSPGNELEAAIFSSLLPKYGNIYSELLVSGAGLSRLYTTVTEIHGDIPLPLEPAQVSSSALDGSNEHCVLALDTFCALLGSACGDFLLHNGAFGGLYIAGGIVPRMVEYLRRSSFLERLQDKGAMRENLAEVSVKVITADHPGLIGAANISLQDG